MVELEIAERKQMTRPGQRTLSTVGQQYSADILSSPRRASKLIHRGKQVMKMKVHVHNHVP